MEPPQQKVLHNVLINGPNKPGSCRNGRLFAARKKAVAPNKLHEENFTIAHIPITAFTSSSNITKFPFRELNGPTYCMKYEMWLNRINATKKQFSVAAAIM